MVLRRLMWLWLGTWACLLLECSPGRAFIVPTTKWEAPAARETGRGRDRGGKLDLLLQPPERYSSDEWAKNLINLPYSRIARRVSSPVVGITGEGPA
jgi:hypothetical protein